MEKRLNQLLEIALKHRVTDIHFSYDGKTCTIEMREGGVMKRIHEKKDDARFFRYLLFRANMDLSAMHHPQTGRFTATVNQTRVDLRFSMISSLNFMSGVLRILNNHAPLTVEMLTFDETVIEWLYEIEYHRSGLYVFSGPTGSGKTTTLYTILNSIEGKKIYTLEDPIEIYSDRYVQLQINESRHLSYAEGIKQLMRQDPDIVMIGEIRDEEAAKMALRCALTGHLVVTSIHSSSCVNAIHRLLDLGVNRYELRDVLTGISNQRLYETVHGEKIGIYEIMNQKEVNYYFENSTTSKDFKTLADALKEALRLGILSEESLRYEKA